MSFKGYFTTLNVQEIYRTAINLQPIEKRDCLQFLITFYFKRHRIYTCKPNQDLLDQSIQESTIMPTNLLNQEINSWLCRLILIDSYYN